MGEEMVGDGRGQQFGFGGTRAVAFGPIAMLHGRLLSAGCANSSGTYPGSSGIFPGSSRIYRRNSRGNVGSSRTYPGKFRDIPDQAV